eukprot:3327862-Rhodomonas_salina.1
MKSTAHLHIAHTQLAPHIWDTDWSSPSSSNKSSESSSSSSKLTPCCAASIPTRQVSNPANHLCRRVYGSVPHAASKGLGR